MTAGDPDKPPQGIAVYNPSLLSREALKRAFVARLPLVERVLADLRRERPGRIGQHRLFLGQWGMGKTSLLRRIAIAVEEDQELSAIWLPLTFPETQYGIADLGDLWRSCLDAVGDALERHGQPDTAAALHARAESLRGGSPDDALDALLQEAGRLGRRLVLLVDNVDLVLERLRDHHWALREMLQSRPELVLIGASARPIEASYQYDAAFYDFFRIDTLKGLTEDEVRATLVRLAGIGGTPAVAELVERDAARIRALHLLLGGNPRIALLLYGVLAQAPDGDVGSDLDGVLDLLTPHYAARFAALPERGQQLVNALALHWDPASARQLADRLGWEVNLVSAQLDRLQNQGIVEKTEPYTGKRALFQIADRLLNIWFLMRTGRRHRRQLGWLARFLYSWLNEDAGGESARQQLGHHVCDGPDREPRLDARPDIEDARLLRGLLEEGGATLTAETWAELLPLIQEAARAGRAAVVRDLLDTTEAAERWRPLREALAAAAEGSADYLRLVAPEVRKPAQEILQRLKVSSSST